MKEVRNAAFWIIITTELLAVCFCTAVMIAAVSKIW